MRKEDFLKNKIKNMPIFLLEKKMMTKIRRQYDKGLKFITLL